ncbi:LPXTG cell wall anchor domain-containing protein [Streptomyces sp. NPDC057474]|uniref:LPXTG cell wall anchor domain-containing protein n=1 Tax=Streptomyces sp. NPDC057474 TaxID=3346144 RepID=UPI0036B05BE4
MSRTPGTRTSRTSRTDGRGSPSPSRLGRLLRQDKNDPWAVRMLPRIVFGLAAAYTFFMIASQSGSSFVMVGVVLLLGGAVWLLRRRTQLLLALTSTILATAFTGYFSAVGDAARMSTSAAVTGTAAFGYWALAGMALLGAWMVKEHPGRRGVTVVIADVILVIGAAVGMFVPEAGVPIGFVGVLAVLAVRGSGAKAVRARADRLRQVIGRSRRRDARKTADS